MIKIAPKVRTFGKEIGDFSLTVSKGTQQSKMIDAIRVQWVGGGYGQGRLDALTPSFGTHLIQRS